MIFRDCVTGGRQTSTVRLEHMMLEWRVKGVKRVLHNETQRQKGNKSEMGLRFSDVWMRQRSVTRTYTFSIALQSRGRKGKGLSERKWERGASHKYISDDKQLMPVPRSITVFQKTNNGDTQRGTDAGRIAKSRSRTIYTHWEFIYTVTFMRSSNHPPT